MEHHEQVGNHPALDFVNTERANAEGPREMLEGPADLGEWFGLAGWDAPSVDETLLNEARVLRTAIRRLVEARVAGKGAPTDALEILNAALGSGTQQRTLGVNFEEQTGRSGSPLAQIAEAAVDLLCHQDMERVRSCGGSGCVLWFLDTSKNGKRRWCSMAGCGNREKAAAHYRREKGRE